MHKKFFILSYQDDYSLYKYEYSYDKRPILYQNKILLALNLKRISYPHFAAIIGT